MNLVILNGLTFPDQEIISATICAEEDGTYVIIKN